MFYYLSRRGTTFLVPSRPVAITSRKIKRKALRKHNYLMKTIFCPNDMSQPVNTKHAQFQLRLIQISKRRYLQDRKLAK